MRQSQYGIFSIFRGSLNEYQLFDRVQEFLFAKGEEVLIEKWGIINGKLIVVSFQPCDDEAEATQANHAAFSGAAAKLSYNELPPLASETGHTPDWFNLSTFWARFADYFDADYFEERKRLQYELFLQRHGLNK